MERGFQGTDGGAPDGEARPRRGEGRGMGPHQLLLNVRRPESAPIAVAMYDESSHPARTGFRPASPRDLHSPHDDDATRHPPPAGGHGEHPGTEPMNGRRPGRAPRRWVDARSAARGIPGTGLAALAALAALGFVSGCRTPALSPPQSGAGPAAPSARRVPLAPDPGPATLRPLDPGFSDRRKLSSEGYLRLLVDLREQVDTEALLAGQLERGLTRQASRTESLEALDAIADRGRTAIGPLLDDLVADGRVEFVRYLRYRNRVYLSAKPAALDPLRAHPAVAELIPEYDSVRDKRRESSSAIRAAPPIPPGDSWGVGALGLRPSTPGSWGTT